MYSKGPWLSFLVFLTLDSCYFMHLVGDASLVLCVLFLFWVVFNYNLFGLCSLGPS